jgi:hypothetical protein
MILECIWNDFASTRRIYNQTSRLQPSEILRVRLVSADLHFHPTAQDVAWKLLERTWRLAVSKDGLRQSPRYRSVWWSLGFSGNAAAAQRNSRDFFHVPSFLPSSLMDSENWARWQNSKDPSVVTIDFRHMCLCSPKHHLPPSLPKNKDKKANTGLCLMGARCIS